MPRFPFVLLALSFPWFSATAWSAGDINVTDYPTLQAAVDANPGKVLHLPSGVYELTTALTLNKDGGGLEGPGHIIQKTPGEAIVRLENAARLRLRGLTLSRPEGATDTSQPGITARNSPGLTIDDVTVLDNRTDSAAIAAHECDGLRISRCTVENYQRVSVDNRMGSIDYGYVFRCTNGTGIEVAYSSDVLIESNRVVESNLFPTREMQEKHQLGKFTEKAATKGRIVNQKTWDDEYAQNWQQGSAIIVTAPKRSRFVRILGNHVENAAQGVDIHADNVTMANNMIVNAFMGMKAMHGSRHILITGNHFIRNAIWCIGLMPGSTSQPGSETEADNSDGGSLIANNIIAEFAQGDSAWIWGDERAPIRFDSGQLPSNPPLSEVLVTGNVVYDSSALTLPGKERRTLYRYAVLMDGEVKGLHFSGNLFHPGRDGIANLPLEP